MNSIHDSFDLSVDLSTIGFPYYTLYEDKGVWSDISNKFLSVDCKGCVLLRSVDGSYHRLSIKVLVGRLIIAPRLLYCGFVYVAGLTDHLIDRTGSVFNLNSGEFLAWNVCKQYAYVHLAGKSQLVHRLVATTFIPNPMGYSEVNHINGDKLDNRVENLEWCDRSMNMKHAYANGYLADSLAKAFDARRKKQCTPL